MKLSLYPVHTSIARSDLVAAGFAPAEIDALEALRAAYPYVEFFDSRQELQRLRFMKWMISRDLALLT
jgi:hypothetical protein